MGAERIASVVAAMMVISFAVGHLPSSSCLASREMEPFSSAAPPSFPMIEDFPTLVGF